MLFMYSKQFENFVVDHFLRHSEKRIKAGYKYQFKSPNPDNSKKLFRAFTRPNLNPGFIDTRGNKLTYISCNHVKLIPVVHNDGSKFGYTENFISYLRDQVSDQNGAFEGTALLIIHNSLLDTLINSSEDLSSKGGIFSPENILVSLRALIDDKDSYEGQEVSKILLEYQFQQIIEDQGSMFGFEALHDAITDGDIRFQEIDLFNDPAILSMGDRPNQIRKRLDENKALHEQIAKVVQHYPDQIEDYLTDFSSDFISKHINLDENPEGWKLVPFDVFLTEKENNRNQELELSDITSASSKITKRQRGTTASAQRETHIILEVDHGIEEFDLELDFRGSRITKDELAISTKSSSCFHEKPVVTGGSKNSKVLITGKIGDRPIFFNALLKRKKASECYKFRCLVVRKNWFNIDAIASKFLLNPSKDLVILQTQEPNLIVGLSDENQIATTTISKVGDSYDVTQHYSLDFEEISNEVELITFSLFHGDATLSFEVEGAAATEYIDLPIIYNTSPCLASFIKDHNAQFNNHKKKVYIDNKEVKLSSTQIEFCEVEHNWVKNRTLSRSSDGSIDTVQLGLHYPALSNAYDKLFEYLSSQNSIPSLVSWGEDYRKIVKNLVTEFRNCVEKINLNEFLLDTEKLLISIGFSNDNAENQEWISPFHPLVLNYYLELVERAQSDNSFSFKRLPPITLERLNPQGLLPYIYDPKHEFSYVQSSKDNCFWLRCVPQQDSDYSYITKLVKEKIREFSEAFSCLFPVTHGDSRPTLLINSVNNRDNRSLFLGIVGHFSSSIKQPFNIHVNIYDDDNIETEFDQFSEMGSYEAIKNAYGLNKGKVREYADAIVDDMRTRLTFSKFRSDKESEYQYSHLCFFRNREKVEPIEVNPTERANSISAEGLINGEAAQHDNGNYITGFGCSKADIDKNTAVSLAVTYGRLIKPARKSTSAYRDSSAIALAVNERFKSQLEKCYESSIWTTIIDPKVTLDFFQHSQNVILIHYSDQYTTSAGYDAITVTKQIDLYRRLLDQEDGGLVTELNAFNGEWLLKLLTDNEKIRKERRGILAAYKLVSILLSKSDITWIPISVAELIRVSGNIGLNISESEFSRKLNGYSKGAISDDVLFVGFKDNNLYLLPLEVKTGSTYDSKKAIQQANELKQYLSSILSTADLAGSLNRSLFVRQVILQLDKYILYDVYPESYLYPLIDSKEKWLQGDYKIAHLSEYPSGFVVANLENDRCFSTSCQVTDGILTLEIPSSFMKATISTPLRALWEDHSKTAAANIPEKYFLPSNTDSITVSISDGFVSETEDPSDTSQPAHQNYVNSITHTDEAKSDTERDTSAESNLRVDKINKEGDTLKVLIGHECNHQSPVFWEPTNTAKFMNTNSGIIGTMGTGKTQCTKSLVTQLYRNQSLNVDGSPIGMLIFDYKSDYVDDQFQNATNGKKYNLHKLPYNPLSLFGDTPMLPVHTARGFSETMGKAFGLGQKQQLRLRKLIADAYDLAGISKSDKSTWSKPAPTIKDVWTLFIDQEKVEEDSLYAALESLNELEIFEDDISKCISLYQLIDGIRVIELAGYPPEIQNLVVALTLDLFYSQMQKQGKPTVIGDFRQITKMILVDEADNFMSQDFPSLRRILKEGREYGVGVILSTQDITHFKTKENDYSVYILSWIVHRVSQIKGQDIKALFNKDDKPEQESLMAAIRGLDKHFSLYVNGDKKIVKIKDKAFWELLQTE
ncbi:DNA phosphorothioation-dependent restriction protein DptH [Litorivivens lipolytica]|nr:DNA phosphorothioation-dependent restriction protein DptH [Litorivivens lipolytica]